MNTLTNSSLTTLRTCPEKYRLMYVEGIRPEREADYFRLGGMYHLCQEMNSNGATIEEIFSAIERNYSNPPNWVLEDPKTLDAWRYESVTVTTLFQGWQWRWAEQPLPAILAEQTFEIPIWNPDTNHRAKDRMLAGKIDKIIQWGARIAVNEYKTTSEDLEGSDYWDRLKIDTQPTGYILGGRALGYPVESVLYDVTRKPTIRPSQVPVTDADGVKIVLDTAGERVRTKDGKKWRETGAADLGYTLQTRMMTLHEWQNKLWADIQERPDFYYARREIVRDEKDILKYQHDLWSQHKLLMEMENNGRFFKNPAACLGRTRCPMFAICTQGIDITEHTPAGYTRVTNPHQELEVSHVSDAANTAAA